MEYERRADDPRTPGSHRERPAVDRAVVERWRNATPAEHGRALWGLLEFADMVQAGRGVRPEREPLRRLPKPRSAEHQT